MNSAAISVCPEILDNATPAARAARALQLYGRAPHQLEAVLQSVGLHDVAEAAEANPNGVLQWLRQVASRT